MRTAPVSPLRPDAWADRRVVVVVAHPDDEVLGCGALIATLRDIAVIHVTDGAPRDESDAARHGFAGAGDYAAARHAEAVAALALAGVPPSRLSCLGVADQDASEHLVAIARTLAPLIESADVVLTHAYEGGHGDHDAVAFAVQAAHALCAAGPRRMVIEMPFYHAGPEGWMRQRFLPLPGAAAEFIGALTPAQGALKARMLAAHATQAETLAAFSVDAERFRQAPAHDFTARPHGGPLLYERHGWNLTWPLWQARAEAALATLGRGAG